MTCQQLRKSYSATSTFKDTHREKARLNETPAPIKSTNMGIWFVSTTNQLFIRGY